MTGVRWRLKSGISTPAPHTFVVSMRKAEHPPDVALTQHYGPVRTRSRAFPAPATLLWVAHAHVLVEQESDHAEDIAPAHLRTFSAGLAELGVDLDIAGRPAWLMISPGAA